MGKLGRTPLRTHIYSGILLYLALLSIGKGIELIWFVLQESAAITRTDAGAITSGMELWRIVHLGGILDAVRMWAVAVIRPLAVFISGSFPLAGAMLLSYPLVGLGVLALAVSVCFFVTCDFLTRLHRRLSGRR